MGKFRSRSTRDNLAEGAFGRVRSSLTLALFSLAFILSGVSLAYSATNPVSPIPSHAVAGQRGGAGRLLTPAPVRWDEEPISHVGHGGFFDQNGKQIVPTAEFVARAQSWYRERLLSGLSLKQRAEFSAFKEQLGKGLNPGGQSEFVLRQRELDWLVVHSPRVAAEGRMRNKLNALKYRLQYQLPVRDDLKELHNLVDFKLDPAVEARLKLKAFSPGLTTAPLVTANDKQAYIDECKFHNVPIPPSIGVLDANSWKSLGFIPTTKQFIVGTPAEVRVFENNDGMCIALPRYKTAAKTIVSLDGVICLSKTSAKVCFWDNQMNGNAFEFPAGTKIPIGLADLAVNNSGLYQAGGAEIEFGDGGVCTDCHAGENPYIIHPDAKLDSGIYMSDFSEPPLSLPTFGPKRYDPIVGATWPQNKLSMSPTLVPQACITCHTQSSGAGRFPHLSTEYNGMPGYCKTILTQAIDKTMPLGNPGGLAGTPEINDFLNWCGKAAEAGPSDRGDPHLTTTNGVHYDFQAAGEFTALRNSDTGFELQTRQTPVLTTFTPGANPHTGLASCVSLNTAAALRVGRHRISYQPNPEEGGRGEMQLRIDGKLTSLPKGGLDLGDGNHIAKAAAGGGIDVQAEDGTRVFITPNYWTSQGYWYLNIEVLHTPAREGTMGHILSANWLPLAPDGSSFGSAPAGLAARHTLLNETFADAWRVKSTTSLFDYASGTSTASFTNEKWPPPPGSSCTTIIGGFPWPGVRYREPVRPLDPETARRLCSPIQDPDAFEECIFDVTVMGNGAMVNDYLLTLGLRSSP